MASNGVMQVASARVSGPWWQGGAPWDPRCMASTLAATSHSLSSKCLTVHRGTHMYPMPRSAPNVCKYSQCSCSRVQGSAGRLEGQCRSTRHHVWRTKPLPELLAGWSGVLAHAFGVHWRLQPRYVQEASVPTEVRAILLMTLLAHRPRYHVPCLYVRFEAILLRNWQFVLLVFFPSALFPSEQWESLHAGQTT